MLFIPTIPKMVSLPILANGIPFLHKVTSSPGNNLSTLKMATPEQAIDLFLKQLPLKKESNM